MYATMLIKASQLRDKDAILEMLEQQQQGPSPEQQKMQELQMAGAQAEVEKTQSEAAKNTATAQATQAGILTDAYRAGAAA